MAGAPVSVQRQEALLAVQGQPPLPFVAHQVFGNRICAGRHQVFHHLPMPAQRRQVKRGAAVLRARAGEKLQRRHKSAQNIVERGHRENNGKKYIDEWEFGYVYMRP
jgi:hypothetical protein